MERTQREYYLNEQMKAIQKELGDGEDGSQRDRRTGREDRRHEAEQRSAGKGRGRGQKAQEYERQCPPRRPWCATISIGCCPFRGARSSRVKKDLGRAQKVLDDDHYSGLRKSKSGSWSIWPSSSARRSCKGPDPLPCWPSRRGQDVSGQIRGQGHGAGIHPHLAWAVCAMRARSAVTGGPISAPCPARSFRR